MDVPALLPLLAPFFQILVALAAGYAIMPDSEERTAGQRRFSPGTLYWSIERIRELAQFREAPRKSVDLRPVNADALSAGSCVYISLIFAPKGAATWPDSSMSATALRAG